MKLIPLLAVANAALGLVLALSWFRVQTLEFDIISSHREAADAAYALKSLKDENAKMDLQRNVTGRALSNYAETIDQLDLLVSEYDKAYSTMLDSLDLAQEGDPLTDDEIRGFEERRKELIETYDAVFTSTTSS